MSNKLRTFGPIYIYIQVNAEAIDRMSNFIDKQAVLAENSAYTQKFYY